MIENTSVIESKKAFEEAKKYLPGGVNSPVRAFTGVREYPLFIAKAEGSYIYDISGNKYIDFCQSWGVAIVGHAHEKVIKAVVEAAKKGTSYGAPTLYETELARMIIDSVPSIEKVRFVNSGTEAVMSAIRLARAYTKKDIIVKFDGCYHGHSDALLVSAGSGVTGIANASSDGVPAGFIKNTVSLPFNDIKRVEETFATLGSQIAAVIIEPVPANMGLIVPHTDFLLKLRELTTQYNALLIFDEVITGFRLSRGGAQAVLDILPDITTLGKIIGGGFPVGAYGASAKIMSLIAPDGPVYQAGTLSGNPVAVNAGISTLQLLDEKAYDELAFKSGRFLDKLSSITKKYNITLNSYGNMFSIFFTDKKIENFEDVKITANREFFALFYQGLLSQGVYFSPSLFETNFVSLAHDNDILDYTVNAVDKALDYAFVQIKK